MQAQAGQYFTLVAHCSNHASAGAQQAMTQSQCAAACLQGCADPAVQDLAELRSQRRAGAWPPAVQKPCTRTSWRHCTAFSGHQGLHRLAGRHHACTMSPTRGLLFQHEDLGAFGCHLGGGGQATHARAHYDGVVQGLLGRRAAGRGVLDCCSLTVHAPCMCSTAAPPLQAAAYNSL